MIETKSPLINKDHIHCDHLNDARTYRAYLRLFLHLYSESSAYFLRALKEKEWSEARLKMIPLYETALFIGADALIDKMDEVTDKIDIEGGLSRDEFYDLLKILSLTHLEVMNIYHQFQEQQSAVC